MSDSGASWDFPRGLSGIRVLLEVANDHGLKAASLLSGTEVACIDLYDANTVVSGRDEMTVIRNLLTWVGDEPGLGVSAGRRFTVGMLGAWGFLMLLSPTVDDLLDAALRHGHGKLSWIFMRPTLTRGALTTLELDGSELATNVRNFVVERDLAGTATAIRAFTSAELPLVIETDLPDRRVAELAAVIPAPSSVRAGSRNAFVFDSEALAKPLPMADPLAAHSLERQVADLAAQRARHVGLAGRIRSALLRQPESSPTLAEIAADRHIDPRTVRRQLCAEGTSFRKLREEVRYRMAVELLCSGDHTVAQVANRLGYAEAASFSRAFRRWSGTSPGEIIANRSDKLDSPNSHREPSRRRVN